tara:strand:+ start:172 stop:345 length:174 start_codon:yes stop_codon:yes gene_type:complete
MNFDDKFKNYYFSEILNKITTKYPSFFELNADEKFVSNLNTTKYAMEDIKIFLNEKY